MSKLLKEVEDLADYLLYEFNNEYCSCWKSDLCGYHKLSVVDAPDNPVEYGRAYYAFSLAAKHKGFDKDLDGYDFHTCCEDFGLSRSENQD